MRIAILGAPGQLGSDLVKALARHELAAIGRGDLDVAVAAQVQAVLPRVSPQLVINLTAYHRVDDCEDEPEPAFQVNALGVYHLARTCRNLGAALLHVSTDYVFDGAKGSPYVESDPSNPINLYGVSKLAGEGVLKTMLDRYWLVRTSGLYGLAGSNGKGGNFIEMMLRLAEAGKPIRVVDDQVLTPTYTVDLAQTIAELIATERYGLYHITSGGSCSWYEFARHLFELKGLQPEVLPVTSAAFGAKARRPPYSVLENAALLRIGLNGLRPWQEALAAYLAERSRRQTATV